MIPRSLEAWPQISSQQECLPNERLMDNLHKIASIYYEGSSNDRCAVALLGAGHGSYKINKLCFNCFRAVCKVPCSHMHRNRGVRQMNDGRKEERIPGLVLLAFHKWKLQHNCNFTIFHKPKTKSCGVSVSWAGNKG